MQPELFKGAVLLAPMLSLERVSTTGWNPYLRWPNRYSRHYLLILFPSPVCGALFKDNKQDPAGLVYFPLHGDELGPPRSVPRGLGNGILHRPQPVAVPLPCL